MGYIWNPNLETGHAKIDEQHRQLFNTLNKMATAFLEERGGEVVLDTLAFLTDYTVMHFETEENLMTKHNYPDFIAHKQCHGYFKDIVSDLTKRLHDEGPSEDLVVTITAVIGDWLISHIRVDDIKMASFINSNLSE